MVNTLSCVMILPAAAMASGQTSAAPTSSTTPWWDDDFDGGAAAIDAGLGTIKASIGLVNDPNMESVGVLLTAFSSVAPLLTFIPPPYGLIAGAVLGAIGGELTLYGSEPAPTNADVIAAMQSGIQAVSDKVDISISLQDQNLALTQQVIDLVKEQLLFKMDTLDHINVLFQKATKYLDGPSDGPNIEFLKMALAEAWDKQFEYYTVFAADNFRDLLNHLVDKSHDVGTFCDAAKQVQWFMATRHELYWLLMMHTQFNEGGWAFAALITDEFQKEMGDYEKAVNAWNSTYLWQAIQANASHCESHGIGHNCNKGTFEFGDCKCVDFWQKNTQPAPRPKLHDDGSLKLSCSDTLFNCNAGQEVHIRGNPGRTDEYFVGVEDKCDWWDECWAEVNGQAPDILWKVYPDPSTEDETKVFLQHVPMGYLTHDDGVGFLDVSDTANVQQSWTLRQANGNALYLTSSQGFFLRGISWDLGVSEYKNKSICLESCWSSWSPWYSSSSEDYHSHFTLEGNDGSSCAPASWTKPAPQLPPRTEVERVAVDLSRTLDNSDALSSYTQLQMRCSGGQAGIGLGEITVSTTQQCADECDRRSACNAFVIWGQGTKCYLKKECRGPEGQCAKPNHGCGYRRSIDSTTPAPTPAVLP